MEYTMRLNAAPFEQLRNGTKRIELRLYDEKRKKIKTGDTILFISLKDPNETVMTRVSDIYRFDSFEDLYKALPLADLGYGEEDMATASPKDMEQFYSQEQQAQYGVVGFRLDLIPRKSVHFLPACEPVIDGDTSDGYHNIQRTVSSPGGAVLRDREGIPRESVESKVAP